MVGPRTAFCAMLLATAVLGTGCGESGPNVETVDVAGTVTLDGKPLNGVTVVFVGEGAAFVGMGKTGPDGKYRLDSGSIPGKQGAMPGRNQVYFTTTLDNAPTEPPIVPPFESEAVDPKDSPVPAKYSNPVNPALTFDVPEDGTQTADFQLSSK